MKEKAEILALCEKLNTLQAERASLPEVERKLRAEREELLTLCPPEFLHASPEEALTNSNADAKRLLQRLAFNQTRLELLPGTIAGIERQCGAVKQQIVERVCQRLNEAMADATEARVRLNKRAAKIALELCGGSEGRARPIAAFIEQYEHTEPKRWYTHLDSCLAPLLRPNPDAIAAARQAIDAIELYESRASSSEIGRPVAQPTAAATEPSTATAES